MNKDGSARYDRNSSRRHAEFADWRLKLFTIVGDVTLRIDLLKIIKCHSERSEGSLESSERFLVAKNASCNDMYGENYVVSSFFILAFARFG